jgi:hypothetical protein
MTDKDTQSLHNKILQDPPGRMEYWNGGIVGKKKLGLWFLYLWFFVCPIIP